MLRFIILVYNIRIKRYGQQKNDGNTDLNFIVIVFKKFIDKIYKVFLNGHFDGRGFVL